MHPWLRALVGVSILFLLIYLLDFRKIASEFSDVNIYLVYLVVLTILGATMLGAIAMFLIVSRESEILFSRFLPIYWMSWSVSLVVPGQIGDIASISILLKRLGFEWSVILARSLVDKVISLLIMSALAIYALTKIVKINQYNSNALFSFAAVLVVVSLLLIAKRNIIAGYFKNKKHKVINFVRRAIAETRSTILFYPKRVIANIFLTTVKISLIGLAYWFMFNALGENDISVWSVIPLVAASSLVAYVPISLNGIGTVELTGIFLFSSIGLSEPTVLTAFLLLRGLVFALAWLPTSVLMLVNRKVADDSLS